MHKLLCAALLLIAPVLCAQPFFGEPVPQTHTRYGTAGAEPQLVTNGQDFFLLWATESKLRVTRLVEGQKRAGRPILSGTLERFDAVWTGAHFLVVADDRGVDGVAQIRGRLLNAIGEPISAPFGMVAGDSPRLAFDGSRVLMTYRTGSSLQSILLRPDGVPATDPHHQAIAQLPIENDVAGRATGFVAAQSYANSVQITTLLPSGEADDAWQLAAPPVPARTVAVASNGQEAVAVWTNGGGAAEWVKVRANGTLSGRTPIAGSEGAIDASIAWNGTRWIVSTIAGERLRTRLFDDIGSMEAHTPVRTHDASPVNIASLNGRTLAAWRGSGAGQPVFVRDLAPNANPAEAAFSAAEQTFHTGASSHEGALAVWSEVRDGKRTLHAGMRTTSGSWRENRIGTEEDAPLASSDGNNFLVVRTTDTGWSAVTLDPMMQIQASTAVIKSFMPTDITWDGTGWVIIGVAEGERIYVVRVMPWGQVSAPVLIEETTEDRDIENPRIAAGGNGFLAVWQNSEFSICFPVCDPYESVLHGTRLTATLQRVDLQNMELAPDEVVSPDLYWDGTRFQIYWLDGGALETRSLRPDAGGSGTTRITGAQIDTDTLNVTSTPFGTMVTSDDGEVLLIRSGDLITRYSLGNPSSPDALVNLGSEVAYLQTLVRDEMPYHGASHVFLRVGSLIPPETTPVAPRIVNAVMADGGKLIELQWAPPAGDVNGYRLEYRVDDGTWNELDAWFDAGTTSASIAPWLENVKYHFRLRAWSDAGVSEYSRPATVRVLGRRRSMR